MATNQSISAAVDAETKQRLERIALEQSEPGDKTSVSELVREAVNEWLDDQANQKGAA